MNRCVQRDVYHNINLHHIYIYTSAYLHGEVENAKEIDLRIGVHIYICTHLHTHAYIRLDIHVYVYAHTWI